MREVAEINSISNAVATAIELSAATIVSNFQKIFYHNRLSNEDNNNLAQSKLVHVSTYKNINVDL